MVTLIATEDSYVSIYQPSSNYGSGDQIRTEYWDGINEIGYIKFDLSQYSSSDILSAKLRLYIEYDPVGTAYRILEFRRVTGSWSEGGITWNNKPSQTQDGALILEERWGDDRWIEITVTQLIKDMIENGNNGFSITDGPIDATMIRFASRHTSYKPELVLTTPTTGNILCVAFDENGVEISGALIYKDGVNSQQYTPYTFTNQNPGTYHIDFEKTGYTSCSDDVTVVTGMVSTAYCTLVSIPTTGSLSVTSNPTFAAIYLDGTPTGKLTGTSPVILSGISAGVHTIVFVKSTPKL